MTPTVRSRLFAAGTSFLLGFVIANYGILRIPGPDRWLWLTIAIALMITGAAGVLIADSPRRISVWAVVGVEVLVAFTVVPLLWMFTVATSTRPDVPRSVMPDDIDWSVFGHALTGDLFGRPLLNSLLVALVATLVGLIMAVPAAYATVRMRARYGPWLYIASMVFLLAPLFLLDGALADQLRSFGLLGSLAAPIVATLLLTVPLSFWLCVSVMKDVPWTLRDAVTVDGASPSEVVRVFFLPVLGPGIAVAGALTFIAALNDVAVSATMLSTESSRTLPGAILLAGQVGTGANEASAVALVALVPVLVLLLCAPRRILQLFGRTYR
jgi:multiple sugar transport system permease protein